MNRRKFIQKGALAGSFLGLGGIGVNYAFAKAHTHEIPQKSIEKTHNFNLNYAPHIGMFKALAGEDPLAQLIFMASIGFTAFEDSKMLSRPLFQQKQIAATMENLGMSMGAFVAHKIYWTSANLASGKQHYREEFLNDIRNAIAPAKLLKAKWISVVPGYVDLRKDMRFQTANVVESLKQAAALLEPHGIVMVLEPLNFKHKQGMFLSQPQQAYQICKKVASPSCKMLFDTYHPQIEGKNVLHAIQQAWDEIAYFKIGDNPGRNEPTTGKINFKKVFKYIHSRGFEGVLGMEHGTSFKGKEGEWRVIDAYVQSDKFL